MKKSKQIQHFFSQMALPIIAVVFFSIILTKACKLKQKTDYRESISSSVINNQLNKQ